MHLEDLAVPALRANLATFDEQVVAYLCMHVSLLRPSRVRVTSPWRQSQPASHPGIRTTVRVGLPDDVGPAGC